MATAAATGNGRISRLPSLTPGSRGRRRGLAGPRVRRWKPGGSHALFPRELRPGRTRLTREPSRAVDRQTHEDNSLNRRQEPGHATSSHRLALSSRYRGSPGFGRLCRYPARVGSGPNHGATALDLPKTFARAWQSRSANWLVWKPNEFALTSRWRLEGPGASRIPPRGERRRRTVRRGARAGRRRRRQRRAPLPRILRRHDREPEHPRRLFPRRPALLRPVRSARRHR